MSRVQLRLALGQENYARFCAKVRKVNIQTLCSICNNDKGDRSIDLRSGELPQRLVDMMREFVVGYDRSEDRLIRLDEVIEWADTDIFTLGKDSRR